MRKQEELRRSLRFATFSTAAWSAAHTLPFSTVSLYCRVYTDSQSNIIVLLVALSVHFSIKHKSHFVRVNCQLRHIVRVKRAYELRSEQRWPIYIRSFVFITYMRQLRYFIYLCCLNETRNLILNFEIRTIVRKAITVQLTTSCNKLQNFLQIRPFYVTAGFTRVFTCVANISSHFLAFYFHHHKNRVVKVSLNTLITSECDFVMRTP